MTVEVNTYTRFIISFTIPMVVLSLSIQLRSEIGIFLKESMVQTTVHYKTIIMDLKKFGRTVRYIRSPLYLESVLSVIRYIWSALYQEFVISRVVACSEHNKGNHLLMPHPSRNTVGIGYYVVHTVIPLCRTV